MLKCKECWTEKKLDEYYKHPEWYMWVLWRCKECIKSGRRTEKERIKARLQDKKRNKNESRLQYIKKYKAQYRNKNNFKIKAHKKVFLFLQKHALRENFNCVSCGNNEKLELHHENYDKALCVIPLCNKCHNKYHCWKINIDKTKEINLENFNK